MDGQESPTATATATATAQYTLHTGRGLCLCLWTLGFTIHHHHKARLYFAWPLSPVSRVCIHAWSKQRVQNNSKKTIASSSCVYQGRSRGRGSIQHDNDSPYTHIRTRKKHQAIGPRVAGTLICLIHVCTVGGCLGCMSGWVRMGAHVRGGGEG